jgi:hypothetical protein
MEPEPYTKACIIDNMKNAGYVPVNVNGKDISMKKM